MAPRIRIWLRRPIFWIVACMAAALLAWGGYFGWLVAHTVTALKNGGHPAADAQREQFQASVARTLKETPVTAEGIKRIEPSGAEPVLGNPDASVRIVEFVDYQCPYCQRTAPVIRDFMRRHAADAFFILRDFPILDLHPDAEDVAVTARCVFDQGNADRFWKYHDRLYASQEAQSPENLRLYAGQAGADLAAYDRCVTAKSPLAHIRGSFADGVAAGISGTPTFFFNGVKIQGAIDADSLEIIFQEAKKNAAGTN